MRSPEEIGLLGGFRETSNLDRDERGSIPCDRRPGRDGVVRLPVHRWPDAAALREYDRPASDLSAGDLPDDSPVDTADQPSEPPASRHIAMPASARLRHVWKLPVAAGLSIAT